MKFGVVRCVSLTIPFSFALFGLLGAGGSSTASSHRGGIGDSLSVGAIDSEYRRAGGSDGNNVFKQIDWPTPTEMRLGSGLPGPDYWQQQTPSDPRPGRHVVRRRPRRSPNYNGSRHIPVGSISS